MAVRTTNCPPTRFVRKSWLKEELDTSKNFKQWFKKGMYVGMIMTGIEHWLCPKLGIKVAALDHPPHRSRSHPPAARRSVPEDRLSEARWQDHFRRPELGVRVQHQPQRAPARSLTLKNASVPVNVNLASLRAPSRATALLACMNSSRTEDNTDRLQINAQNCVHCKTCDIKDPTQNIVWITPEGGGGPNYAGM